MLRRAAVAVAALCLCACGSHATAFADVIDDDFNGPNGLIASEGQSAGPWEITSGSLFRDNGTGWTGKPDDSTGSAVFRMASLSHSFNNANMTLLLRVDDLVTTHRTPRQDYDGVHIWVGYQSQYELYAVSVDRRDGNMTIKKKCAGGDDNGGTYYDLNGLIPGAPIPMGSWQHVTVSVRDQLDGSVKITASRDGLRMEAVDTGVGCAPLRGGGVGIRGDNAELRFARIVVQPLEGM